MTHVTRQRTPSIKGKLASRAVSFFIYIWLGVHTTASFAQCGNSNKFMVIHSYHPEFPWVQSYSRGIEQNLEQPFSLTHFYMDTKRKPASEFNKISEQAWQYFLNQNPRAVILSDDNALRLLGPKFVKTNCNIVYLGINNNPRNYGMLNHNNVSGVLERPRIKRSMLLMNHFLPIRKALVLFDNSVTAQVVQQDIFNHQSNMIMGITSLDIYLIDSFTTWKEVVSMKYEGDQAYDAIFIGLYHTLTNEFGQHVPANTVLNWTSENVKVPLFAFWDFSIGQGKALGGYVLYGEDQGKAAAKQLINMLTKSKDTHLNPATGDTGRYLFSRSKLKRWSLKIPEKLDKQINWIP